MMQIMAESSLAEITFRDPFLTKPSKVARQGWGLAAVSGCQYVYVPVWYSTVSSHYAEH